MNLWINPNINATRITVSVVGMGVMGTYYSRIYKEMPNVKLVGMADTNINTAKDAAHQFGIPVYTDYRIMLEKERPNVVSVTTPASFHEEISIAALQSGAHVIVEKPMATTLKGAAGMIATARQLNRQLMVAHIERFSPVVQKLRSELQKYDACEIEKIISRRLGPFPERVQDVGVVLDTAIHDIDLIFFLTRQLPHEVVAEVKYELLKSHEDTLTAKLHFKKRFTADLDVNWINIKKKRETIIHGSFGIFHADHIAQKFTWYPSDKESVVFSTPYNNPLEIELKSFIHAINNERAVPVDPKESFLALYLALALFESAKTATPQKINFNADALINKLSGFAD